MRNRCSNIGKKPVVKGVKYSIERKNGLLGYSPENCVWATEKEQKRNRGDFNVKLTFNGETLLMVEWSERTGIAFIVLQQRKRMGWSDAKIITTPVRYKSPKGISKAIY